MKKLKIFLKEEWYPQAANAVPLYICAVAHTSLFIHKFTGFDYTSFLGFFCKEYGKFCYRKKDLDRIGKIVKNNISKDKGYLARVKRNYNKIMRKDKLLFNKIEKTDLKLLDDEKLFKLCIDAMYAFSDTVGISHIIEPFTLTTAHEMRDMLYKQIKDKSKLNSYFNLLTTPKEKSFFNDVKDDLIRIKKEKENAERDRLIKEHIKRFFWIRNNYSGKQPYTKEEVEEELKSVSEKEHVNFANIKKERARLIKKLRLSKELVEYFKITEFFGHFQDERKANILKGIEYADRTFTALCRRFKRDPVLMRYFLFYELSLEKFKSDNTKMLKERREGTIFVMYKKGKEVDYSLETGKKYKEYRNAFEKEIKKKRIGDLRGNAASLGTAIGVVRVCKNINSIKSFKKGEILVASMTRPEYVPAMKKAAAVITDEGGITCHAAIISRELGIPCIIGTKIATNVLKDGMVVEVRANHGLIKILKK